MRVNKAMCMVLLGGLLAGGIARGDTVTFGDLSATFKTVNPSSTVSISTNGGLNWSSPTAGAMNWVRTGGSYAGLGGAYTSGTEFVSFCVELTQYVNYNGSYTYTVVEVGGVPSPGGSGVGNGMGTSKADQLRELWTIARDQVQDSLTAAAFQLAIWEVVYDDDTSLSTGSFQAKKRNTGDLIPATAQNWLSQIDGTHELANIFGMRNSGTQDQVFFQPPPPSPRTEAVPLPGAAWCGGLLLGGLAFRSLRRRLWAAE